MNYKPAILCLILTTLIYSCETQKENNTINDIMIGQWQSLSLDITMNTFQNKDTTTYLNIKTKEWEEALQIKPIVTTYNSDSSYVSVYKNLLGQVVNESKGIWYVQNDSLMLLGDGILYRYEVQFEENKARFTSLLDWDQDGKADDLYAGWQVKLDSN